MFIRWPQSKVFFSLIGVNNKLSFCILKLVSLIQPPLLFFGLSFNGSERTPINNLKTIRIIPIEMLMMKITFPIVLANFVKVVHVQLKR